MPLGRAELSPESARLLALTSLVAGPEAPVLRGVIDRVVDPPALLGEAIQEAERLAAMPAYGRVKEQLRAATCQQLRRIVDRDEEPLLRKWL